jgi:hypothetical protein
MLFRTLAVSSFCCAATASQWTPPDTPTILGDDYAVERVDLNEQVIITQDGSSVTPAAIVNSALPGFLGPEGGSKWMVFNEEWFGSMVQSFESRVTGPPELEEFLNTGKSYGLSLKMNIFAGPRFWNFGSHVHKNIEYMKVLAGTLHEYRSDGLVTQIQPQDELVPLPTEGAFHNETAHAGHLEINEFGSLHTSYTVDDGMLLLTLYNGDWFFGVDGCQSPDFVCTPNGCGKSPDVGTYEEVCHQDWTAQYV